MILDILSLIPLILWPVSIIVLIWYLFLENLPDWLLSLYVVSNFFAWLVACFLMFQLHSPLLAKVICGVVFLFSIFILRNWWNNHGRKKWAAKFGGYKYRAIIARMATRLNPV